MRRFRGLLKREWLEHGSTVAWGLGAVFALLLLSAAFTLYIDGSVDVELNVSQFSDSNLAGQQSDVQDGYILGILAALALDVSGSTDLELQAKIAIAQNAVARPFLGVFLLLAGYILLSCLHDERKDHSVLFWKSMPVTDAQTVASKLIFVLGVAPLVVMVTTLLAQLLVIWLSVLALPDDAAGRIWMASQFWLNPLRLTGGYLILGVWMLPIAGWLMLVSSLAKRAPGLWALGIPWGLSLLESIVFGSNVLSELMMQHLRLLPVATISTGALSTLGNPNIWFGILIACGFLALTVVCRRRYNTL